MGGDTDLQGDSHLIPPSDPPPGWLVIVHGAQRGTQREVPPQGLLLGRDLAEPATSSLTLDDPLISRRHAMIRHTATGWHLVDLHSRNRSSLNGAVLEAGASRPLPDGAVVRLGNTLLVFREAPPLLERASPSSESAELLHDAFPGQSRAAQRVRQQLARLIAAEGPVLILGETGTGKEHVSLALRRPGAPFVPVNCAVLGKELAAAELFGHARAAFTGAQHARAGLVETAHGGVLFFDEIGELPLDVQAMLLRFIEDGCYRPVGGNELRHSNARVVAATNVDLEAASLRGTFRSDLLARLSAAGAVLELPPLRERREDVLTWADRFWRMADPDTDCRTWSAGAAECLLLCPWPRNLRDLGGTMLELARSRREERAHVPPGAPYTLEREHLPTRLREASGRTPVLRDEPQHEQAGPRRLEEPGREEIAEALRTCNGNMRQTAKILGIDRRRLYRLVEKYQLTRPPRS